jgi:hypothetical protein
MPTKKNKTPQKKKTKAAASPKTTAANTQPEIKKAPVVYRALPGAWQLTMKSLRFMVARWRFFVAFSLLYGFLSVLFGHNFATDVNDVKTQLAGSQGGSVAVTGLSTYALVLASGAGGGGSAGAYQYLLLAMSSLALIWALRQFMSDNPPAIVRLRDGFYRGMYPLIPFLLVLLVLGIELLPIVVGGSLYSLLVSNGIVVNSFEQVVALLVFLVFAGISVWLFTLTIFALYIVTLPDVAPMQALRDSVKIVRGRQLSIVRKLLFLVFVLMLVGAVITVPVIIIFAPITAVVLFLLTVLTVPFVHTYLYNLYRELLV